MATINEIKQQAATIKGATQVGENTAERVGGAIEGLADIAQQQEGKLSDLEDKTAIKDEEGNVQDTPFKVTENEEFIHAITDSEDRVLFGIKRDTGKPYFPLNEMYHVEQNEEFFAVWLDAADHVLFGIRRDGEIIGEIHACNALKQVVSKLQEDLTSLQEKVGTIDTSLQELLSVFSLQENEEYLAVELDADGKVLSATNADGSHYIHKVKSETIPTEFEHFEDPEGRMEITTDADGKVLSYRDSEGVKHESKIESNFLNLSNQGFKNFGHLINNVYMFPCFGDLSSMENIKLSFPKCAFVNITSVSGYTSVPTKKTSNLHYYMEFFDGKGSFFRKKVIVNAQGNSSLGDPKKNLALDICNDNWLGENTCSIQFGDWVPQDSFHLKAYYYDTFVGIPAIGYKLFDEIVRTRGVADDRPWKRALNLDAGTLPSVLQDENLNSRMDSGARCFPDGFPCIVYLGGEFYGIFSWQLKKHRDNYAMDKKTATHVHLDGAISSSSFFLADGNIDWDIWNHKKLDANGLGDGIEIRNPKGLIGMDGSKYDFDNNAVELMDETSENYDSKNKDMARTLKVKNILLEATKHLPAILKLIESNASNDEIKSKIEEYFDVKSLIDYIIFTDLTLNVDGLYKNWQWITYDGIKWHVVPYDLDQTFGLKMTQESDPLPAHQTSSTSNPYGLICKYYSSELTAKYKQLRDLGIIDTEHIASMLNNWVKCIGIGYYALEQEKWPQKRRDNIYRFRNWTEKSIQGFDNFYKFTK